MQIRIPGLLASISLALAAIPSFAQQPTDSWRQMTITIKLQKQSFKDALAQISRQVGRSIIADGEPVAQSTDLSFQATAADALDRVADAFDYTWTTSRSGIVLLSKRFHNLGERPQTHSAELRQVASEILQTIEAMPMDRHNSGVLNMLHQIANSLTPQQVETLQRGGGLRVGDMLRPQQQLVLATLYTNMLWPSYVRWEVLFNCLDQIDTGYLLARDIGGVAPDGHNRPSRTITFSTRGRDGKFTGLMLRGTTYSNPQQPSAGRHVP